MSITHQKVSTAPAAADPDLIDGPDWNDDHVIALADGDIPATIARDAEVDTKVTTHAGAADPHGDRADATTKANAAQAAAIAAAATDATTKANAAQAAAIAASDPAGSAAAVTTTSIGAVPTTRTVSAGTGLTGGGDLSANRTLASDFGTGAGKVTQGNDSRLTDARTPTGAAGGDLGGTYPNPSVTDDSHSHTAATLPAAGADLSGVDFLVGTASGLLSAEIPVGTSPGGELGGTWASPTVDATHSGSAHHDPVTVGTGLDVTGQLVELDLSEVSAGGELGGTMDAPTVDATHSGSTHAATQAAAESTAAGALSTHAGAADPHTGYRLESADHTHASTGLQGGTIAYSALTGTPAAERVAASTTPAAIGTAAVGVGTTDARADHVHATGAGTPSTQVIGDAAATGSGPAAAMTDHKHAITNPLTTAGDLWVGGASGAPTRLAKGSDSQVLTVDPTTHLLVWATPSGGGGAVATDAIWDAKGDLAAGTGADTASKLTVGADDTILMADSAQSTGLKWVASQTPSTQAFGDAAAQGTADTYARGDHKHAMPANPAAALTAASYIKTGGDYTTTSTTFVDVDGTNMALTITTGAHRCLVGFSGSAVNDVGDKIVFLDIDVDGTRLSGNAGGITSSQYSVGGGYRLNASFTVLTAQLSAGSHTFKLQWRVDANTGRIRGGPAGAPAAQFWVMEQGG